MGVRHPGRESKMKRLYLYLDDVITVWVMEMTEEEKNTFVKQRELTVNVLDI